MSAIDFGARTRVGTQVDFLSQTTSNSVGALFPFRAEVSRPLCVPFPRLGIVSRDASPAAPWAVSAPGEASALCACSFLATFSPFFLQTLWKESSVGQGDAGSWEVWGFS